MDAKLVYLTYNQPWLSQTPEHGQKNSLSAQQQEAKQSQTG